METKIAEKKVLLNHKIQKGILIVGLSLLSLCSFLLLYSFKIEPYWLQIKNITFDIDNAPEALSDITIVQITDLHCGKFMDPQFYKNTVDEVMKIDPDIIVLTGDYVEADVKYFDLCRDQLKRLDPPLGTYAVMGNHDYLAGQEELTRSLEELGIDVLFNENVEIKVDGESLWILGVDDLWFGTPDIEQALIGIPEEDVKILLCHEPDYADIAKKYPVDIQLSGHSHGGQVRLPFRGALILPKDAEKYDLGLYQLDDLQLYVNPGIGMLNDPAVRFGCPPEISVFRIK